MDHGYFSCHHCFSHSITSFLQCRLITLILGTTDQECGEVKSRLVVRSYHCCHTSEKGRRQHTCSHVVRILSLRPLTNTSACSKSVRLENLVSDKTS